MKKWLVAAGVLALLAGAAFIPVGDAPAAASGPIEEGPTMDLSGYSDAPPPEELKLLFIHHSIGGHLLADVGPDDGQDHIYAHHPNGGGLRAMLEDNHYEVHEASYGSVVGENTDLFDWLPKFRDHMARVLTTSRQDETYSDGERNRIVLFKSCYPNSKFVGEGSGPGDPGGPALTLANAKATMRAVRDVLEQHPDTLFVYLTAPAHAPRIKPEPAWKWVARRVMGRVFDPVQSGAVARKFNNWMRDPDGWLAGYPHTNIVVFDYFDVLTRHGEANVSMYATGGGYDSHPSAEGNRAAAEELVPLLNRAVHRAGLVPSEGD